MHGRLDGDSVVFQGRNSLSLYWQCVSVVSVGVCVQQTPLEHCFIWEGGCDREGDMSTENTA